MSLSEILSNSSNLYALFIGTFLGSSFLPAAGLPILTLCVLNRTDFEAIFFISTLGNWLGAVLTYVLGLSFPLKWLEKVFRVNEQKLERASLWFKKYNVYAAIGSGIPVVGDRVSLVLGIFRTPALNTILLMLVGKALRYAILIPLIYYGTRGSL